MRKFLLAVALAAVFAVTASASAAARSSVAVHASKYGRILFDGRGFALYTFTRDPRGRSRCAGARAKKWPPDIVGSRPAAGEGSKASLLGTIRRNDGSLQRATPDARSTTTWRQEAGQILCQGVSLFGGLWLVERADGRQVE